MKTFLRSWLLASTLTAIMHQASAQCAVSDVYIQNVSVLGVQSPDSCTVKFDASFTIENNNGNKYIFIHTWLLQDYPNYFNCVNGQTTINGAVHAPGMSVLADAFLNIGINNMGDSALLLDSYPPAPGVNLLSVDSISKEVTPDGSAVFVLYGISTTIPVPCGTPAVIVADLWSSQSARARMAHCVNCGILNSAGYFRVAGLVNCASLTYNATITNNTAGAISGFYRVYADINGDNYFTPAIDTLVQDTTTFTLAGGIGATASISGSVPAANINQDLFILITQTSGQASGASGVVLIPSTQCSPLPVLFKSFTAQRTNRSQVLLRWETASEINNSGFALQRNLGNNDWQLVNFINSRAPGGNSDAPLLYTYVDQNTHKGISQYRLLQIDHDGRARFSEVRAVRGEGQTGRTIIYPNPSADGRVTIVFDDTEGTRDLTLSDMNGKIIREWKMVSGNTYQVFNLRQGVYTLRIRNTRTGESVAEKIIVTGN